MAFTLEAALVIPVSIGIIASSVSLALPAYKKVKQSAVLSAAVSVYSTRENHLYKVNEISYNSFKSTALETSPSKLIDLLELAGDMASSFIDLKHGVSNYE
jgi:hypothetical protein